MNQQSVYRYSISTSEVALCTWRFDSFQPTDTRVVPDGCCDFIIKQSRDQDARAFVSALSAATYRIEVAAGTRFLGIRLKPGVLIEQDALFGFLKGHAPQDLMVDDQLAEFCRYSPRLTEALNCLATAIPVSEAAREIGVSTRTLQRLVLQGTGRSPGYWRALARARLAAKALPRFARLDEAAPMLNYADQAHLSREMRRWFGQSPSEIVRDQDLSAVLREPGYATGEQISIRNPFGSVT